MALIKSISGIRGTIGGVPGEGLGAIDIVKFTAAYGTFIMREAGVDRGTVVVGRDARVTGGMVSSLVCGTLSALGLDVVNLGMATTPTTEIAVTEHHALGGIIITASHNPAQWNALKLLNADGEFLNDRQGKEVIRIAEQEEISFADYTRVGQIYTDTTALLSHIRKVLDLRLVDTKAIAGANFTVAVDAVNSIGGVAVPMLLRALGVKNIIELNCAPTGKFSHNPEPLPENLTEISEVMRREKADVGFVVDPDVDRLAIIMENGECFVEEYTLVAVSDYVLANTPGNTVSNLSSSRALRDVTRAHGGEYNAAAVGEVNVVAKMKETGAIIGGEGNGGVIYPELHYGRDALAGIALFLSYMAKSGKRPTDMRRELPEYCISKNKIQLDPATDVDALLRKVKEHFAGEEVNDIDGVKIDFPESWVHLRKSNTEPIVRIYSEAATVGEAEKLAEEMKRLFDSLS
ncbi:MAG: phosphoglucosamine mutase [Porphyromonadaceae bacterium]|jgi:phosphomannomutase|nr:phosphoglucosamine mutase [Porphyromonadaceae bacterium]MDD6314745.1 phosphoglucosamine mutase [Porphyromonadaceae bacterium]